MVVLGSVTAAAVLGGDVLSVRFRGRAYVGLVPATLPSEVVR